jgi:hypothetical protein
MGMEMRRRQRVLVSALFALGYVVTGAGIARVYFTHKAFFTNGDIGWWQTPTYILSTNVGVKITLTFELQIYLVDH